jgi:hypothetical protein
MIFCSWFLNINEAITLLSGNRRTLPLLIHACQHYAEYQEDAYWFRLEVP